MGIRCEWQEQAPDRKAAEAAEEGARASLAPLGRIDSRPCAQQDACAQHGLGTEEAGRAQGKAAVAMQGARARRCGAIAGAAASRLLLGTSSPPRALCAKGSKAGAGGADDMAVMQRPSAATDRDESRARRGWLSHGRQEA